jgi:hypothetical protein
VPLWHFRFSKEIGLPPCASSKPFDSRPLRQKSNQTNWLDSLIDFSLTKKIKQGIRHGFPNDKKNQSTLLKQGVLVTGLGVLSLLAAAGAYLLNGGTGLAMVSATFGIALLVVGIKLLEASLLHKISPRLQFLLRRISVPLLPLLIVGAVSLPLKETDQEGKGG